MITLMILPNFKAQKKTQWIGKTIQCLCIDAMYIVPIVLALTK
jgi:hypothetical protein